MRRITLEDTSVEMIVVVEQANPSDITIFNWADLISQALLGLGYHPDSVKDILPGEADR